MMQQIAEQPAYLLADCERSFCLAVVFVGKICYSK